jgi:uncharacterized membrane protein YadS
MVVLASTGVFTTRQTELLGTVSDWLFLVAFAGLGLSIDVKSVRGTGLQPAVVVSITLVLVSGLTLGLLLAFF